MSNPNNQPERLTEQLRRQDLQNRVNDLSEMMQVLSREEQEAKDPLLTLAMRWEMLRYQRTTLEDFEMLEKEFDDGSKQMPPARLSQLELRELRELRESSGE
jgi:hypothetical protein